MTDAALTWCADRTAGAPEVLRTRTQLFVQETRGDNTVSRLAHAGERALEAAITRGGDRRGALDLLAADALITLALLAQAEADPAGLGAAARVLRLRAVG